MKEANFLDLSWSTIFKIGAFLFLVYLIFLVKEILILALFAFLLSFLVEPAISFLEKKISRPLSVLFVYLFSVLTVGFLVFLTVSPIFSESQKFVKSIPEYFEKISPFLREIGILASENFEEILKYFQDWLIRASKSIFSAIFSIFGGIFSSFTVLFLAIFISLEKKTGESLIKFFSPREKEEKFIEIFESCQKRVSGWFFTKILGSIFIFSLTLLSLLTFKIEYAFTLSLIAGFFNLIPIVGPIFSGFLIFLISFLNSYPKAFFSLFAFILIQLIESNVLMPILTQKFVGLSPFLTLLSVLIGGKILGFWGAIFSIPLMAVIIETAKEFLKKEE
jgi:predicted PurR-regulated permease PerM